MEHPDAYYRRDTRPGPASTPNLDSLVHGAIPCPAKFRPAKILQILIGTYPLAGPVISTMTRSSFLDGKLIGCADIFTPNPKSSDKRPLWDWHHPAHDRLGLGGCVLFTCLRESLPRCAIAVGRPRENNSCDQFLMLAPLPHSKYSCVMQPLKTDRSGTIPGLKLRTRQAHRPEFGSIIH